MNTALWQSNIFNTNDGGGAGLFWEDEQSNNPVDTLLSSPSELTLEMLFAEPTLLQEVTGHNKTLLAFLSSRIDLLLDYALLNATNPRFSFLAFEILNANTQELSALVVKDHLPKLFQIVTNDAIPSENLASNFHRLLDTLCPWNLSAILLFSPTTQKKKTVSELIQRFEGNSKEEEEEENTSSLISLFLQKVESTSMTSAFLVLVRSASILERTALDSPDGGFSTWTGSHNTAQHVLSLFTTCPHNCQEILMELFRIASTSVKEQQAAEREQIYTNHDEETTSPIVTHAWTGAIIHDMCDMVLDVSIEKSCRVALLHVLHHVVCLYSQPFLNNNSSSTPNANLQILANRFPDLTVFFASSHFSTTTTVLGMERFLFSEIVSDFVLCGHQSLIRELPLDTLDLLCTWFFAFEKNNLLHCVFLKMVRGVLTGITPQVLVGIESAVGLGNGEELKQLHLEKAETVRALEPLQDRLVQSLIPLILERRKLFQVGHRFNLVLEENHFTLEKSNTPPLPTSATTTATSRAFPCTAAAASPAFMGHLRVMATDLSVLVETLMQKPSSAAFDGLSPSVVENWHEFVSTTLFEANQRVNKSLGGEVAKSSSVSLPGRRPGLRRRGNDTERSAAPVSEQPRIEEEAHNLFQFGHSSSTTATNNHEDNEDDDDEDDDDDEEDSDAVLQRYYSRSTNNGGSAMETQSWMRENSIEEEELPPSSSQSSAALPSWVEGDWGEEEEEEEEELPRKKSNAMPMMEKEQSQQPTESAKRSGDHLFGVSPSWVTGGFFE